MFLNPCRPNAIPHSCFLIPIGQKLSHIHVSLSPQARRCLTILFIPPWYWTTSDYQYQDSPHHVDRAWETVGSASAAPVIMTTHPQNRTYPLIYQHCECGIITVIQGSLTLTCSMYVCNMHTCGCHFKGLSGWYGCKCSHINYLLCAKFL